MYHRSRLTDGDQSSSPDQRASVASSRSTTILVSCPKERLDAVSSTGMEMARVPPSELYRIIKGNGITSRKPVRVNDEALLR